MIFAIFFAILRAQREHALQGKNVFALCSQYTRRSDAPRVAVLLHFIAFFLPNEAYDVFRDPPSGKKCGGLFPAGWSGEGVVRGEGHQKVFYFFDGVFRNLEALPRFIMHKNKSKTMLVSFSNKFPPEKIQITPPTPRHA